jgi:hypothetical protein
MARLAKPRPAQHREPIRPLVRPALESARTKAGRSSLLETFANGGDTARPTARFQRATHLALAVAAPALEDTPARSTFSDGLDLVRERLSAQAGRVGDDAHQRFAR